MSNCRQTIIIGLAIAVILSASPGFAMYVGEGNLLISTGGTVYEYTRNSDLVQSFPVPYPTGPHPVTESVRDIVIDGSGNVLVYNGTFDPYMSSYDPLTTMWSHITHTGWSTVNGGTYGGIATIDQYVFVTDMKTYGDDGADEAKGIIRFDLQSNSSERFATDIEPIDLNIGLDGLLYALFPGGSPEGRTINVYNPFSLSFIRSVDLTSIFGWVGHRSIAANANGDIFIADLDGDLQRIDSDGNVLSTINLCGVGSSCNLYDVDVSADGLVVVGDRFGGVIITDMNFSEPNSFNVGSAGIFVSIAPIHCGNGVCDQGEDCNSCPDDCISGEGSEICGNGVCEPQIGEDCISCPEDCAGKQIGKPANRFCCGDGDGFNPVGCDDPRCISEGYDCGDSPGPYCCGDLTCEGAEDSCDCAVDCGTPPDKEIIGSTCNDGLDNDCDGAADCDDPTDDCDTDPACQCLPKGAQCASDSDCCSQLCHKERCK